MADPKVDEQIDKAVESFRKDVAEAFGIETLAGVPRISDSQVSELASGRIKRPDSSEQTSGRDSSASSECISGAALTRSGPEGHAGSALKDSGRTAFAAESAALGQHQGSGYVQSPIAQGFQPASTQSGPQNFHGTTINELTEMVERAEGGK